jgi:hypothetical protein
MFRRITLPLSSGSKSKPEYATKSRQNKGFEVLTPVVMKRDLFQKYFILHAAYTSTQKMILFM